MVWLFSAQTSRFRLLSPRHSLNDRVLPVLAVERMYGQRSEIDTVKAADVDVNFVRVRAWDVKRMNAAGRAERVLGRAGVEPIGGQRIAAAQELELLRRHDQMQEALLGADRAVAAGDARKIRGHTKPHPARNDNRLTSFPAFLFPAFLLPSTRCDAFILPARPGSAQISMHHRHIV